MEKDVFVTGNYDKRFARNIGIVDEAGQDKLRRMSIGVAGLGMGGSVFINLVRLGIGRFHVADPDVYEVTNVNRQRAARERNLGRRKDESLIEEARSINPEVEISAFPEGVNPGNLAQFLEGLDWVVDVVDVFAMEEKLALNAEAQRRGIPVATCAALGFGASAVLVMPGGPGFAELSGMSDTLSYPENLDRFTRFIFPELPGYMRAQVEKAMQGKGHIPFVVSGVEIGAAIVAAELVKHLLGMGRKVVAPTGIYADPVQVRILEFEASYRARPSHVGTGMTAP